MRLFRAAVLEGKVSAPISLALRSALSEARTVADAAANEKLAKRGEGKRNWGRDDLAAAVVLAVAEGQRRQAVAQRPQRTWRYRGAVA